MTIVELIQRDHDEVADLFDHLVVLARDGRRAEEAVRIASRLVAVVRVHGRAEEVVLYGALRTRVPALATFGLAGPHEHEKLEGALATLIARPAGNEAYGVIVKDARDLFEQHARVEEEGEILPLVVASLSEVELCTLGAEMQAEQARVRPEVLRLVGLPARAA
jgi:hypothetical protein